MVDRYEVAVTVKSVKGHCALGHFEGQRFRLGEKTPGGMCPSAYFAMYPSVRVLQFGGRFPWDDDPDCTEMCCSDPGNPVVFELRRVRAE
ncbi:MAG: TIGR04076 family protein [Chloroflexi bacterium]|nr:TIGR04076 family protein [Chloroflexota bacterium]